MNTTLGTLNVIIEDVTTKIEKTLFTKTGNQLKNWHEAEIDITSVGSFKVGHQFLVSLKDDDTKGTLLNVISE